MKKKKKMYCGWQGEVKKVKGKRDAVQGQRVTMVWVHIFIFYIVNIDCFHV